MITVNILSVANTNINNGNTNNTNINNTNTNNTIASFNSLCNQTKYLKFCIKNIFQLASVFTHLSKIYCLQMSGFDNISMIEDHYIFTLFHNVSIIEYDDRIVKLKAKKKGNKLIPSSNKMLMKSCWFVRG